MNIRMMRVSCRIDRLIPVLLAISLCGAASATGQQTGAQNQNGGVSATLPDAPEPMQNEAVHPAPELALASAAQQPNPSDASAPGNAEQGQAPQKPVGTAAAPPEGTAGIMASRPAGAVIAPAKQRRARAIFVRVGLLVGAGVALGTVLALTHATPSGPPQ